MARRRENIVKWLLAGDPAVRWQVMRDLADADEEAVAAERARVVEEGWGAAILALQQSNGQFGAGDDPGWMNTIRTLTLLKDIGADPVHPSVRAAIARVRPLTFIWHGNRAFFDGESEACLNGRILGLGAYFGEPSESLLGQLLGEQLEDGGWNCDAPPSVRSSFNSTICVLEGLLAWEQAIGTTPAIGSARARAESYLLDRHLLRGKRSGEIIDRRFTHFAFPAGWAYDVLRALDYFRAAGAPPDPRMAEAVEIVRRRAHQNGRWPLNRIGDDAGAYVPETIVGGPSRWNTMRALRVLGWYEAPAH